MVKCLWRRRMSVVIFGSQIVSRVLCIERCNGVWRVGVVTFPHICSSPRYTQFIQIILSRHICARIVSNDRGLVNRAKSALWPFFLFHFVLFLHLNVISKRYQMKRMMMTDGRTESREKKERKCGKEKMEWSYTQSLFGERIDSSSVLLPNVRCGRVRGTGVVRMCVCVGFDTLRI